MPKNAGNVELKHPVLSGGKPVLAAGEADIFVSNDVIFGANINFQSGHYLPKPESLNIGRAAFQRYGITFP